MADRGIEVVRAHLAKLPPADSLTIAERRAQYERAEKVFPIPPEVKVERVTAPVASAEWLRPPSAEAGRVVLYLHGGGYVIGSPRSHRHLAAAIAGAAGASALSLGINITALTGTSPTLQVTISGKDAASGAYYTILQSAVLAATGFTLLSVAAGLVAAANTVANAVMPSVFSLGDPKFDRQQDQNNTSLISLGGAQMRTNNFLLLRAQAKITSHQWSDINHNQRASAIR